MLDNLELVLLTIDETVGLNFSFSFLDFYWYFSQIDHGQIMELDSNAVVSRVLMRGVERDHPSSNSQSVSLLDYFK